MKTEILKSIIRNITPPLILSGAKKAFGLNRRSETKRPIGQEQGAEFYDRRFREREHWRQHYSKSRYYPTWTVLADRMLRFGSKAVLDIGCGPGQFASFLMDKGVAGYVGIDFSTEGIAQAKSRCPDFEFVNENVHETELFETCEYDTVVCLEFLEHVEEDIEVIGRIRSGTKFYGTVPNFPGKAHVRHFINPEEVYERYDKVIDNLTVHVQIADELGTKFFIMEGVIR